MDFHFEENDQGCTIYIGGRLTFNDHEMMRALIKEAGRRDKEQVIFDLKNLSFVDSAGVGMLLIANDELASRQKKLTLRNACGQVNHVIAVVHLSKLVAVDA